MLIFRVEHILFDKQYVLVFNKNDLTSFSLYI